jgi:hypothetical protein
MSNKIPRNAPFEKLKINRHRQISGEIYDVPKQIGWKFLSTPLSV